MSSSDDPLLARAKLLVNIANGLPSGPAVISKTSSPRQTSPRGRSLHDFNGFGNEQLPNGSFHVSVIRGSSLVSTHGDVRSTIKRGSTIIIENQEYILSSRPGSEWSASRVELSTDYVGETNMYARLDVRDFARKSPTKKKAIEPVSSSEIRNAIKGLDEINDKAITSCRQPTKQTNDIRNATSARRHSSGSAPSAAAKSKIARPLPIETKPSYFDDFSFESSGSYLAQTDRRDAGVTQEEKRRQAIIRVAQKKKQDMLESVRKTKEEDDRKAALHASMENKARELRGKTLERVSGLQKAREDERKLKMEASAAEIRRKAEMDNKVQSEEYQKRMQQMRQDTKNRMHSLKNLARKQSMEKEALLDKQLSLISEQRRRIDTGNVKKKIVQSREEEPMVGQPMDRLELYAKDKYGDYAQGDDGDIDYGYDYDYEEEAAGVGINSNRSGNRTKIHAQESNADRARVEANVHSEPRQPLPTVNAIATQSFLVNKDDDGDDDDDFWSNDSLGDDEPFNEDPILRDSLRSADFGTQLQQHPPQVPTQDKSAVLNRSVDSDDMTAFSAITLGSPVKKISHLSAQSKAHRPEKPMFKSLKPIPVRPYIPIPSHK